MVEAFSKAQWRLTLLLLVMCGALAAAGGVVGISDNMVGLSLAFLAAVALMLAFVHPWRSPRRFLFLIGVSVGVFVAIVVVGGLLDNAGFDMSAAGDFLFYITIVFCPAGFVVGIIGAVVTWASSRRLRHVPPASPAS